MQPFLRGPPPVCLANPQQVDRWTAEWVDGQQWSWHNRQSEIVDAASRDTNRHCAYCDEYLPDPKTIDHFRPKAEYRELAYRWDNLYLCCVGCQPRKGTFNELVVCPDNPTYRFEHWFFIDSSWNIQPLSGANHDRATKTIEYLRLNDPRRNLHWRRHQAMTEQTGRTREQRSFRYLPWPTDNAI